MFCLQSSLHRVQVAQDRPLPLPLLTTGNPSLPLHLSNLPPPPPPAFLPHYLTEPSSSPFLSNLCTEGRIFSDFTNDLWFFLVKEETESSENYISL